LSKTGTVYVVDDDEAVRDSTVLFLVHQGWTVRAFASAKEFLNGVDAKVIGCLLLDIRMPGMTGLELQTLLLESGFDLPVIFLTGHGDVKQSVQALKSGAIDFLEKPYDQTTLIERVTEAIAWHSVNRSKSLGAAEFHKRVTSLTPRERQVMQFMVEGMATKLIARKIDISPRTVDVYRAMLHASASSTCCMDGLNIMLEEQEQLLESETPSARRPSSGTNYNRPSKVTLKKVCMVGANRVGKTSLVRRFVESIFSEKYESTLGVRIHTAKVALANTTVIGSQRSVGNCPS